MKEAAAGPIGRFEPVPGFASYNLAVQYYPRFTAAYFDRGIVMHSVGVLPSSTDMSGQAGHGSEENQKCRAVPRKPPLSIVPPSALALAPAPDRRTPITAALTP